MKAARIDLIEQYILENKSVSLETICEHFNISISTVRRDLDELVKRGKTKKVYGGMCSLESDDTITMPLLPFEERDIVNQKEKTYICRQAAHLIMPDDIIFIDTGTTCLQLIDYIKDIPCTVITNSLRVSMKASPYENITIISMPGRLNRKTWSYVEHDVDFYLHSVNIQKAFMAATGVSIRGGLTNASEDEYIVKKRVCQNSSQIYLLADHDKFDRMALYTYCALNQIDGLITDRKPSETFVTYCESEDIRLIF